MSDLPSLKTKLEQADGPVPFTSDELFVWARGMGCEAMAYYLGKALAGSIDAALTLVERLLPGWRWEVRSVGTAILHQMEDYDGINDVVEVAPTPALALLLALVTALIISLPQNGEDA